MCKCVRDADRVDSLKPHFTKNDVSTEISITKGRVVLKCTRFKTRIRSSLFQVKPIFHTPHRTWSTCWLTHELQHLRFETDQGNFKGYARGVSGKSVQATPGFSETATVISVTTIGKEGLTNAGASRASLVLSAFKGANTLLSSPFVRKIFFPDYPSYKFQWPPRSGTQPRINFTHRPLNGSQLVAVQKCISNNKKNRHVVIVVSSRCLVVLVHSSHSGHQGPPGTGKTTVIAAAVQSKVAEHKSNTVWVIAHSNVAVKNVAEKLVESGFEDFKLLVSRDFHYEW